MTRKVIGCWIEDADTGIKYKVAKPNEADTTLDQAAARACFQVKDRVKYGVVICTPIFEGQEETNGSIGTLG
jgi:hypothetical protein